jgi:hypothetical protein
MKAKGCRKYKKAAMREWSTLRVCGDHYYWDRMNPTTKRRIKKAWNWRKRSASAVCLEALYCENY